MHRIVMPFLKVGLSLGCLAVTPATAAEAEAGEVKSLTADVLGVYFTPPAGAADAIIRHIDASHLEVRVQAYGFTHRQIAQALARAQQRGVRVYVLVDQKSALTRPRVLDDLRLAKVELRGDARHAIAHNKLMLIDTDVLVTGSFNFTYAAENRNAENVLVLRSAALAEVYRRQWDRHWMHSQPWP